MDGKDRNLDEVDRSDLGLYYEMVGDSFFYTICIMLPLFLFYFIGIFGRHNIGRIFGEKNIVGFGWKALFFYLRGWIGIPYPIPTR